MARTNFTRIDTPAQALEALDVISRTIDRIIAVAIAGNAMSESGDDPQCKLFEVIEHIARIECDHEVLLKEYMQRLAESPGA